jgi:hypothetical protein
MPFFNSYSIKRVIDFSKKKADVRMKIASGKKQNQSKAKAKKQTNIQSKKKQKNTSSTNLAH